jgi:2-polyprenyl-6-methoxyphenol hydroxylase-like FAD-dependent oxidoreductase
MHDHSTATSKPIKASVLIVGAGPVGLTLAMDLARRSISVVVVEVRSAGEPPSVKCNHVSSRSMEVFRRLGVARTLRDAGLPADYPNDCAYRTTTTGIELSRIPIPCRRDRYTATGGPDTDWPTAEPPHRINQIYMEPVLFAHAAGTSGITILNRTAFEGFEEIDNGIVATRAISIPTGLLPFAPTSSSAATARAPSSARRSMPTYRARRSSSGCSRPISARPDCLS